MLSPESYCCSIQDDEKDAEQQNVLSRN